MLIVNFNKILDFTANVQYISFKYQLSLSLITKNRYHCQKTLSLIPIVIPLQ